MKKLLLTVVAVIMLGSFAFAEVSDIDVVEVAPPTATKWRIDQVQLYAFSTSAKIIYRKGWMDGGVFTPTGEDAIIRFDDEVDNPETVENEEKTEFTDLINYIQTRVGAGDTLKQAITKAVKVHLGI